MRAFFADHPSYVVAEPFISTKFSDISNFDIADLKQFAKSTWERFDPLRDERLAFIQEFWSSQGIDMDGSYRSMGEFENWIWQETEKWVTANPRPAEQRNELGEPLPGQWPHEASMEEGILSLARDISIYWACCILKESGLSGTWRKWAGNKNELTAGYPIVVVEQPAKIKELHSLVYGAVSYMARITYGYVSTTKMEELGTLSRSVAADVHDATGRNIS